MIFSFLVAVLIPLLLCLISTFILWPSQRLFNQNLLIKVSISAGIGFGISSIIYFLWLAIFGTDHGYFIFENSFFIFLIIGLLFALKVRKTSVIPFGTLTNKETIFKLHLIFYVVFFLALFTFIALSIRKPHGGWDAWAIWNMRAIFLFRGGENWENAFSNLIGWSHPDYPLLIPISIARVWKYIGSETVVIPIFFAGLFTFSLILLIVSSLAVLHSKSQGILAGLVLLGTPFLIRHGASQYADVPLGFFLVSTIILFTFYDRLSAEKDNLLILAGITAGLSAWTKNEGFLFIAAIITARIFIVTHMQRWKMLLKEMRMFSIGLMPVLMVIFYFKVNIAPTNDLILTQGSETFQRLLDLSRYFQIFKAYIIKGVSFTHGVVGVPLLAVYFFLVGIKKEERDKMIIKTTFILLVLMLSGYFIIYIVTPHDLKWHLDTSLDRLFLQLWPTFVFWVFLVVRTPEEILFNKRVHNMKRTIDIDYE